MKPSVQKFQSDQPEKLSKREDKKRVNHKWNSRLFFQIGLIASLILTIVVVESTIGISFTGRASDRGELILDPPTMIYMVDEPKPLVKTEKPVKIQKPVTKIPIITDIIKIIPDDMDAIIESPVAPADVSITKNKPVKPIEPENPLVPEDINSVEFVPVFPGCESLITNDERKQCLSDKIRAFIAKKFDTEEFSYLDSGKTFRIDVQFKIDATGQIIEIRSRAPERSLEKEAERVINLLPSIKPGMQGTIPVEVFYRVPISFRTK